MMLGLVLSGGGARGAMHLGCMQALEEEGLTFQYISGTSAGALVGALYCKGYSPREILEIIEGVNFLSIFRPALNWRGLINIEKAYDEIKKYMGEDSFEALNIPLFVSATDIQKGKVKVFSKGELIKPVLASCSVPVIFDPIRIGRKIYVDGGITDNLPVKPIKKKCTKVIGLHCNPIGVNYRGTSWRDMLERSLVIAITRSILPQKKKCDLFIEPQEAARYRVSDFKRMRDLYRIGYEYTGELIAKGALDKFKIRNEA